MPSTRKRTFIATLGFTETLVLATIPVFGLEDFDKLIVITSKDSSSSKQTAKAIKGIERLIASYRFTGKTIDFQKVFVKETDFNQNLSIFCDIIKTEALDNREVYINLSGGMRILVITLFLASVLSYKDITTVMISPENQKGLQTLEIPKIRSIQFE
jgi:CRISPR locus-related DNA-binding protein